MKKVKKYLKRHQLAMELGGHFQKEVMLALSPEKLFITEMMTKDMLVERIEYIPYVKG